MSEYDDLEIKDKTKCLCMQDKILDEYREILNSYIDKKEYQPRFIYIGLDAVKHIYQFYLFSKIEFIRDKAFQIYQTICKPTMVQNGFTADNINEFQKSQLKLTEFERQKFNSCFYNY